MRAARLILVAAVTLVVQVGFLAALRPFGVVPDAALALVALIGLTGTASTALLVGLVGGLAMDLTSGADFGLRIGLFTLVALVTGLVHRAGLTLSGPLVALVLVAVATVVGDVAILAGLATHSVSWPLGVILGRLGWEIMLNLGLTLGLRPLVRWAVAPEPGVLNLR